MLRNMLVALILAATISSAAAQVFNPATPVVPSLPPPPTPPAATPGMNPPPAVIGQDSRTDQGAARPRIGVGNPSRETQNDRAIRCSHQAGALGVPPGARGQYVAECVNN